MNRWRLCDPTDPTLVGTGGLAEAVGWVDGALDGAGVRPVFLEFARVHPDALLRSCPDGHLTGSALVLDGKAEHVLLLRHRKLGRWLQPGGHADGDGNLAAVALREATEETGMDGLRVAVGAVDLDVHEIVVAGERPHLHLDVRFLVVAPSGAVPEGNHESTDLRWVPVGDLGAYDPDRGLTRLAAAALAAWQELAATGQA